jgi:putative alpha-1,2-mannosidase
MGFYPVCPGSPVYEIGSPIFDKTSIRLQNGKQFTIVAHHVSAQNKYIRSATLNGKPLERAWLQHTDIRDGGTLILEMSDHPNTQWGSRAEDAPPSMSDVR